MGKKSRKKKKQEKKSDGSTGNVNGGGSSSNNNSISINHNNNISISTVDDETVVTTTTTTTTTMVLTQTELEFIDNDMELKGYPKSNDFVIGYRLWKAKREDTAIDAFKRGAENDGCVPCMVFYVYIQRKRGNFHLLVPYAFEGAIRGNIVCMDLLIHCYNRSKPAIAYALASVWTKMEIELGDTHYTEEERKEMKKDSANFCYICRKQDLEDNDVTLVQCGICKSYSYCGKNCQTYHWKEWKHMNECRHLILLRKYCKPQYVKEIRDAIIDGQDPKEIRTLQRLRTKLGLNRPKEDYEELLLSLANDDDNNNNNNNNNILKPGTKVKVKGLVKAAVHNEKIGIITKVSIPGQDHGRVGVELSDDNGGTVVVAIKIENLDYASASASATMMTTTNNTNRLNPLEYLVGRKDGTVHIGSTPHVI